MHSHLNAYFATVPPPQRSSAAIAFLAGLDAISEKTPDVARAISQELADQRRYLKMIASENYSSLAVQLAMGNCFTDKYAEGFPHHRFYAGCDNLDIVEDNAVESLKKLFGCEHAYVQPHSGADANLVAYWAILMKSVQHRELERLGKKSIDELLPEEYERVRALLVNQKILGLSLNSGGHLTHGYRHNISSKMLRASFYDVDPKTEQLNYDEIARIAREIRPTILLAGYSAYTRRINFATMREIADSVGATFMVDMAHFAGLVAGKVFQGEYDPVPYAEVITSTTHKTLRGPRGGIVLCTKEFKEYIDKGCPLVLGGPLPHVICAKAIAFREALELSFATYAHLVVSNAQALARGLQEKGIRIISGGTENHIVIIDVSPFQLTGRQAENALRLAHITCNRNTIPFDKNGPWYTSGLRLGTPALSTLGMTAHEMQRLADIIYRALTNAQPAPSASGISKTHVTVDEAVYTRLKSEVREILSSFPLYPEIPYGLEDPAYGRLSSDAPL